MLSIDLELDSINMMIIPTYIFQFQAAQVMLSKFCTMSGGYAGLDEEELFLTQSYKDQVAVEVRAIYIGDFPSLTLDG